MSLQGVSTTDPNEGVRCPERPSGERLGDEDVERLGEFQGDSQGPSEYSDMLLLIRPRVLRAPVHRRRALGARCSATRETSDTKLSISASVNSAEP